MDSCRLLFSIILLLLFHYDFGTRAFLTVSRAGRHSGTSTPLFGFPPFHPGKEKAASTDPDYRYLVVEQHVPILPNATTNTARTAKAQLWDYWKHRCPTKSQFRKACRLQELILVRRRPTSSSTENTTNANDEPPLPRDLLWDDEESQAWIHQAATEVEWVQPWTIVPSDSILRLGRVERTLTSPGYPQSVTGFVVPPPIVTTQQFTAQQSIVYEDAHLAVVDKPAGVVTIGVPRQDLQSALPFVLTPPPQSNTTTSWYLPRPVHRLDRATRGLVLVAKDLPTMQLCSQALASADTTTCRRKRITKTYTAIVHGVVVPEKGNLTAPIDGKNATSTFHVIRRSPPYYTAVQVQPITGRTHQIRRHLAYELGHAIVGDTKYYHYPKKSASTPSFGSELHQNPQQGLFLCATQLVLEHPMLRGTMINVSMAVPSHFTALLDTNDDATTTSATRSASRTPSVLSSSLSPQQHRLEAYVQQLREEWQDYHDDEGVACPGEPAVDPSRFMRPHAGDSEWVEDW